MNTDYGFAKMFTPQIGIWPRETRVGAPQQSAILHRLDHSPFRIDNGV